MKTPEPHIKYEVNTQETPQGTRVTITVEDKIVGSPKVQEDLGTFKSRQEVVTAVTQWVVTDLDTFGDL